MKIIGQLIIGIVFLAFIVYSLYIGLPVVWHDAIEGDNADKIASIALLMFLLIPAIAFGFMLACFDFSEWRRK